MHVCPYVSNCPRPNISRVWSATAEIFLGLEIPRTLISLSESGPERIPAWCPHLLNSPYYPLCHSYDITRSFSGLQAVHLQSSPRGRHTEDSAQASSNLVVDNPRTLAFHAPLSSLCKIKQCMRRSRVSQITENGLTQQFELFASFKEMYSTQLLWITPRKW